MTGKNKCKILKDIRRQIAADNDIAFVTEDCQYQGECTGTCPKCEAEVRYLEQELTKRQQAGKAIAVAGLAATILVNSSGCLPSNTTMGEPLPPPTTSQQEDVPGGVLPPTTSPTELLPTPMGEVPETQPTEEELMGEPVYIEPEETQPAKTRSSISWPTLMGVPFSEDDYEEDETDHTTHDSIDLSGLPFTAIWPPRD